MKGAEVCRSARALEIPNSEGVLPKSFPSRGRRGQLWFWGLKGLLDSRDQERRLESIQKRKRRQVTYRFRRLVWSVAAGVAASSNTLRKDPALFLTPSRDRRIQYQDPRPGNREPPKRVVASVLLTAPYELSQRQLCPCIERRLGGTGPQNG